ncbi:MAG TPA: hypothetical protein VGF48_02610 [Thermoanaerobaculia bacterium]|jgi:hypothetical protein
MDELDAIQDSLRRQRKSLDDLLDETSSRKTETAALIDRIEEWRLRSERTQRGLPPQGDESEPHQRK